MEKKLYEEIEKHADMLQHNATVQCNSEIQKATFYCNGYQQGVEDLLKYIRRARVNDSLMTDTGTVKNK